MDQEEAIQEFLGEQPRSNQIREWRITLEDRLRRLREEQRRLDPEAGKRLARELAQLERQVEVLREEEAVTEFVEDSVRATLSMGAISEAMREFEE